MPSRTGKVYVDVYAQTAPAEKALLRIQKIANNPLNLNIRGNSYAGPLGKITGQVSEFEKSLEASNARVTAFGASAGIIYGVSRAFEALVRTTIDVQKQLNDIKVILNTNNEAFAQFSNELFNVANKTGQSFKTAAEAALELARQGLGLEATLKRTNAALALTRISGLSAAESVEAITAAINSFNKSALDDITLVSKLSNVDTRFAVSSQDLAEALSRVGSTAQDAGLNIDELIGLVTAVQQTTSRGGAVIGNAFKNIFTRLSRSDTIEQLKALGVQIDSTQTGLQKLNAISQAIQNVGIDQANTIKELSGGVYQINVVSAALSDLSKAYSLTSQATKIAGESTNEAEVRIKELNKTLSALLNETVNNLTRFGAKIGESAFVPNFDTLLKNINELLVNTTNAFGDTGDDAGFNFAEAFFKGFGQFVSGPALGFATVLISKLFIKLSGFVGKSIIKLVQINDDLAKQTQLIGFTQEALLSEQSIIDGIRNKTISVAQAQDMIVNKLREINNLRQIELGLINQTAKSLATSGFKITKTPIGSNDYPTLVQQVQPSKKKGAAEGFIPNFNMAAVMERMGAYAGGYKPGAIKTTNISKVGKVVYNSAEQIKKFPGFDQPAIIPPKESEAGRKYRLDFVDKLGFDPYHNKAEGFVPNFLPTNILSSFRDTLKYIKDKKYNLASSIQSDYPNATSSTVRGSYNPNKDSIKILDSLDDFDKISTLGHESIHRVIEKSGLAPKFADISNDIFGKRKRYGSDLMNIPTIRRVRGAKDLYNTENYLEEMFADISSYSINDKRQLGKLLKLNTNSGELYPRQLKTAFKLSQRLIKASKQSLFSADGFVPNFVPPVGNRLGSGAGSSFFDLNKSFKGVPIGKKIFKDKFEVSNDVPKEYKGFNLLKKANLPPFVGLPKIIGTEKRSVERGYIGKEVIKGRTRHQMADLFLDSFENKTGLSDRQNEAAYDFANAAEARLDHVLDKLGISITDLRNGGNVIFNDQFIETSKQLAIKNPKFLENLIRSPRKLGQVLNAIGKKRGAKVFPIDFELARKNNKSDGFVPNFAIDFSKKSSKPLGSGYYGSFYDLNQSINNTPIGYKQFYNDKASTDDILNEYRLGKQLAKLNPKVKGVRFPNIYENEDFVRANRGIVKELITDKLPLDIINQNISKLKGPLFSEDINSIVEDMVNEIGNNFGFQPFDVHEGNYAINQRGFDILNDVVAQRAAQSGKGALRDLDINKVKVLFKNTGGLFSVFDTGLFSGSDKLTNLTKTRSFPRNKNEGFVPNFVNPKNRYTLGYNKFRPNPFGIKDLLSDPKGTLSRLPFRVGGALASGGYGLYKKYIEKDNLGAQPFFGVSRYLSGIGGVKKLDLEGDNIISGLLAKNYNNHDLTKILVASRRPKPTVLNAGLGKLGNLIGRFRLNRSKTNDNLIQDAFDFDNSTFKEKDLDPEFNPEIKAGDSVKFNHQIQNQNIPKIRKLLKLSKVNKGKIGPINYYTYGEDGDYLGISGKDLDFAKYGSPFLSRIKLKNLQETLKNRIGLENSFFNNGFIPNFAMPIAGLENAIDREVSAGVPKSAVRVGKHSTLISTKNPQGLGVYNTIHEPKGLIQGIQRSKLLGINPKTHGASEGFVPNFAPAIKPPKAQKVAIFDPTNLPKSFQKVNTPTSTTQFSLNKVAGPPISEEFIGKVNEKIIEVVKNIDAFGAEWTKTSQFRKLSKELDGLVSSVTSNKTVFNTIKNTFKKAATDAADYQKNLKTYNAELAKAQTIEQERRQNLVIEASKFRIFPSKKAKAAEAELTQIAKTDPTAFNQLQEITRRRDEKRAQVGLAASFIVPIVTSAISEAAGTSTPARRQVGASADFVGSIASSAALGSTIGPQGTVAGALFGFGLGIDKFVEQITTALPELEKEFDRSSQKLEQFNNAISQYGSALEKYQGALSDISGSVSTQDVEKFRKNTINRLLDIPVEFRSQIAAASGSISSLNDVVAELGKKLSDDEKIKKFSLALQEIFESSRKITYLDFITLDPKDPKFKQNKEEISKILSSTIDPKIISDQSNKIIDLAKKVQFEGGNGIQELLTNLESIGKIPASITEKLGNISKGGGAEDAKQIAKLIEDVFKSFESTKKFTDIAEKSRKSLSELTAQFNVTIENVQKQLSLLVSSLGAEASQSAKSILTKNKLGRGNEQFNVQRSISRAEGSLKLGEQFLSPKTLLAFNSSLEESQNKFDQLKSIQDAVGQAQEKSLSIFTDELLKAGSDLSELGKKAADRSLTPEDKITQIVSEKNLNALIKAFESIAVDVANNPNQAVPILSKDFLKSFNISDNLTQEILLKSNDVLIDLRNEILSINEISNQNNELLKINNEYNAKLIAQQAKLNQFGGIKTFIDRSSLSEFESLIKEGAGLRFGGNTQDQGIFSAKLIDLLGDPNKLNLRGEQIPKPLFDAARLGRTQSIIQDIDYAKIAAQLSGAFDTEQLSALDSLKNLAPEIADIQVKSLAKFDSLPDVALDINYNILELNKQLGEYINSYIDKNEISFRNALDSSKVSSFIGNIQETTKAILQKNQEIIELNRSLEIERKRSEIGNLQQNRQQEIGPATKDFITAVKQLNINKIRLGRETENQIPEEVSIELANLTKRSREIQKGDTIKESDFQNLLDFVQKRGTNFKETTENSLNAARSDTFSNIITNNDLIQQGKFNTENINIGDVGSIFEKLAPLDSRIAELNKNISELSKASVGNISNIIPTLSSENITPISDIPATPAAPKSSVIPDNLKDVYSKLDKIKKIQSEQIALEEQKKNLLDNELKNTLALAQSLNNIKNINKENNAQYEIALKALNEMRELKLEQEFRNAQVEVDALSKSSHSFAEEIAQARKEANTLKARLGELTPGDLGKQFLDSWHTNFATFQRDLNDGVAEIGYTMKDSFKEGFKEFIKGTKDANEALRDFALNVANKALDIATNIAFDQIFSAVGKGLNSIGTSFGTKNKTVSTGATGGRVTNAGIKGYATGGLVTGGSGNKDDVAAMLSPGEYVIKQDSVKALGTDLLDKLNEQRINPTTIKKLDNGVEATFLNDLLYEGSNINKPTDAKLIFDPNLSSYALTDENNPANARRFQKEEELISYLQGNAAYERQKKEALRQFKRGKEQSFYSQLIAAAVSSAAGAYNQYGNQQKTNSLGRSTSDPYGLETTNNKQYNQVLRNKGGIIPKYANGGYHTDNIPALLTGGEYVISKEAVRKYGMDFFDKVNGKRFADGGPVDYNTRTGISTAPVGNDIDSELSASINRMSAATEALSSLLSNNTGGNGSVVATQNNAVQPNVNITINVADNGKVSAQSNSNVSGNDNNKSSEENRKTTVDQSKQLTQLIQSEVIKIIQQQQRDGGLLSSARPR